MNFWREMSGHVFRQALFRVLQIRKSASSASWAHFNESEASFGPSMGQRNWDDRAGNRHYKHDAVFLAELKRNGEDERSLEGVKEGDQDSFVLSGKRLKDHGRWNGRNRHFSPRELGHGMNNVDEVLDRWNGRQMNACLSKCRAKVMRVQGPDIEIRG